MMSLPWNTGVKLCPNKDFGCNKKYLSEEELEEHVLSCQYRGVDVKLLIQTVHTLEDKMERVDALGVPSLVRRLELLESRSRGDSRRQDSSLELRDIRDRLEAIETASQAIRDDARVSALAKQVEQLEQRLPEASDREEQDSRYRELKISYHKLLNDVSQLRDSVSSGTGRRRPESADESVQTQIAELRKKQRSELRGLGEQVDSLTLASNSTNMDLRKLRMKLNSEVQAEVSELKERLDKVQRSCWTLEEQLEGGKGAGREGPVTGQAVSKEMVNQLLDEMGVFDSARDMDGVSVELKLLQTKVDILEESQKALKLRLRSQRDRSGSLELPELGETEDEGVEKLFEEIRKLKTSLAVTNTELQAGFKRTDNRLDRSENYISDMQQAVELVKYPNDSRVIRLEQQLEQMGSSRTAAPAVSYELQVEALRRELGSTVSRETGELRKELGETQELNRDSIDVIQQKCNSLYSECSSLNRKMEQVNRQMSDKLSPAATEEQELLLHLEQGVKELQESYDSQLERAKRDSGQLAVSVDSLTRDMEQMQSGLVGLERDAKRVWGEEGVVQRLEGIEEFLQRDLPSMGLTTSQKATLEKLIEERSDSVKAVLTEEIAEQVVEMRKMIPDLRGQGADLSAQEREVEEKMDRFKRQVRDLDQNAAKIFQSLTADMQKLSPKADSSQLERLSGLEQEVAALRDALNRRIKQDTAPKLPPRQPDSLTSPPEPAQTHPPPAADTSVRPAIPARAHFSVTPPIPLAAPAEGYAGELLKRCGEKCPVSGERLMRVSRVHRTIVEQATVLSDPFLSTQDGYQLRLQVCLLPSQSGIRVKILLEILPSESDEVLQWPVEGSVRYYVLNQIHDFAHIHLDDSFFFYRPTRSPISLKSSILTVPNTEPTGPYCLNDCLYVRAQILNLSNVC